MTEGAGGESLRRRPPPDYSLEHRKLFEEENQGVYQCGDLPVYPVHAPLGYLGNVTFIVGDDGVILYDTGVNADAGGVIAAAIRDVTEKPVRTFFYSHHHTDHSNGTTSIVDRADAESGAVKICAWSNFLDELANESGEILPRQALGIAHCGGGLLPPEERHHHGIGLRTLGNSPGYIPPTHFLDEDVTLPRIVCMLGRPEKNSTAPSLIHRGAGLRAVYHRHDTRSRKVREPCREFTDRV